MIMLRLCLVEPRATGLQTTVKLGYNDHGYNDHGYNEFTLITNRIMSHFWSKMTGYKDSFHGYNASRL